MKTYTIVLVALLVAFVVAKEYKFTVSYRSQSNLGSSDSKVTFKEECEKMSDCLTTVNTYFKKIGGSAHHISKIEEVEHPKDAF